MVKRLASRTIVWGAGVQASPAARWLGADKDRAGRVIVSSGPFVTLVVAGQPIGGTVAPGTVPVEIEVQAPPWIDVSHVELVQRGFMIARNTLRPLLA